MARRRRACTGRPWTWHEYGELLRQRFADLEDEDRDRVLDAARRRTLELSRRRRSIEERGFTAERVKGSNRYTQLKRYHVIADSLSGGALNVYHGPRSRVRATGPSNLPRLQHVLDRPDFAVQLGGPAATRACARRACAPRVVTSGSSSRRRRPRASGGYFRRWSPQAAPEYAATAAEFIGLRERRCARCGERPRVGRRRRASSSRGRPLLNSVRVDRLLSLARRTTAQKTTRGDPHWGWARQAVALVAVSRGSLKGRLRCRSMRGHASLVASSGTRRGSRPNAGARGEIRRRPRLFDPGHQHNARRGDARGDSVCALGRAGG